LKGDGKAIFFAPERGDTRKVFLDRIQKRFSVIWLESEKDAFILSPINS
jgi:hypothetical protein